jgi:hypothetical protein
MKMSRIVLLAGLVAATSLAAAQSTSKTLATVEGQVITEQQVLQAAAADLTRLDANKPQPQAAYDRARLQILWRALDAIVEDRLITLEAAKNNMTKARLIEIEIDLNIQTPSAQEVDQFYEANKAQISAQIPGPKAQALPQVRQYMIDDSREDTATCISATCAETTRSPRISIP